MKRLSSVIRPLKEEWAAVMQLGANVMWIGTQKGLTPLIVYRLA